MRAIVREENYAFDKIYLQLEKMDFTNFICSPLINGGCGLGKTTALTDDRMYELFKKKLNKENPKILVIESRSTTRDQLRTKNTNPNFNFLQFDAASRETLGFYDIIIIDEAHSLFSDSEFAPRATAPLADWLRKSLCFQIYITASDVEFVAFAEKYFENKEFELTFPDLDEVHVRYIAKNMFLSVSAEKVTNIIKRKQQHFFEEGKKGLFFILSAKDVVELYNYYSNLGYRCGFYVSQQNQTQIIVKEAAKEDDPDDFDEYSSRTVTIDILDYYKLLEKQRRQLGQETMREALLMGHFPNDVDFLFMTAAGQEGLSLFDEQLDFIFIEDTYPLTINQKIFRYRSNVDEVFIHLPQRRIEQALIHTLKKIQELLNASQEYLRGYYEGSSYARKRGLACNVWFDEEEQKYKVTENNVAYELTKSEFFRELCDNKEDYNYMKKKYGQYSEVFYLIDSVEEKKKDILINFFQEKDGVLVTESLKEKWLLELKELGLTNNKQNKDFSFQYITKYCREQNICDFIKSSANKKDVAANPEVEYRKKYLRVNFILQGC